MSHSCEKLSLHREERVRSYLTALEKLISRLSGDELLETLKEDSISQGFIAIRIQEIVESSLLIEKEAIIDKLLKENQLLCSKLEEKTVKNKENIPKNNENSRESQEKNAIQNKENLNKSKETSESSLTMEKIKKIKQRYKHKYQKVLDEQSENLFTLNKELETMNFELDSKSQELEEFKTKAGKPEEIAFFKSKNEKNLKEIENLRLEMQKKNEKLEGMRQWKSKYEKSLKEIDALRLELQSKAEKSEESKSFKSRMSSEISILQKKRDFAENQNIIMRKELRKVLIQVQELRKSKDFLLNLQINISQNWHFYFEDFQKDLIKKMAFFSNNSLKSTKTSVILTRENERYLTELQRFRSEKTVLEAKNLSLKRGFEEELSSLKLELSEKNRNIESLKIKQIEEISKMKCDFLKETSQLHNNLVSLQKNNETLTMKYDEEMAFFQTNYLNDLKKLKVEYRNKLENLLNNTKGSTNNTNNSGELEEIQENLKNLLRIAEKKQIEKRRRSSLREKSFDSCVREKI